MKLVIACCLLVALLSAGCRKKSGSADSNQSGDLPATATPKGEFTPAAAVPADSPAGKAQSELDRKLASGNPQLQLQVLDELLQAWNMSKPAPPKDVEDFVRAGMLSKIPPAPAGKRFAIDQKSGHVVLVNQ